MLLYLMSFYPKYRVFHMDFSFNSSNFAYLVIYVNSELGQIAYFSFAVCELMFSSMSECVCLIAECSSSY